MKRISKRLCAVVLTLCMLLALVPSASAAVVYYDFELELVDEVKGRSVTERRSNILGGDSLVTVLVGLVSENVTSQQKAAWQQKLPDWESNLDDYDFGFYLFRSRWLLEEIIEKGLEASKNQSDWELWVDKFGNGGGVDYTTAVDLRGYLDNFDNRVDVLDSGRYILTYDPMMDSDFLADVHDNSTDWAYDNFYTFTLTVSRRTAGGGIPKYAIKLNTAIGATATVSHTEAQAGTAITVNTKADEGYEINEVKVVAPNGSQIMVADHGDGTYTFSMPSCAVTVNVTVKAVGDKPHEENCPASKFDDVDLDAWYHEAIDYVLNNNLMSGSDEKHFQPDAPLSRAMVAQIFYNIEGQPVVETESKFPDVTEGKWYYDAVTWAHRHTTVAGYGDGLYRPEQDVTREELVQIFFNYAVAKGWTERGYIAELLQFVDGDQVAPWHSEAMSWGIGVNLLSGKGGKVLDPKEASIRAEAAQLLMNLYENVRDKKAEQ